MNGTINAHRINPSDDIDRVRRTDGIFPGLHPNDRDKLQRYKESGAQITPRPTHRLGWFGVASIIANTMIGTGIFEAPTTILQRNHNIGASFMLWLAGCVASLAGSLVYVEYGLTIPRWIFEDGKVCAPRSGGELNYLQYLIQKPRYIASCLFGIPFFLIGNSAQNSLSFAYHFLDAIEDRSSKANPNKGPSKGSLQAIAIMAAAFACITHSIWRRFGIYLNNIFASVKVFMLMLIILLGFLALVGARLKQDSSEGSKCSLKSTGNNLQYNNSFKDIGDHLGLSGYGTAYLQIVWTFSGLNQANYVLGEIDKPHKIFKKSSLFTVGSICILYMLVNVAYMIVVPVNETVLDMKECNDWNLGREFFRKTLGSDRTYSAFLTVSSLGNIIVTTFTAARVKQEIAKSGILPWAKTIAADKNVSTFFKRERRSNRSTQKGTPVMALFLHFIFTVILLLTTLRIAEPRESYTTLLSYYSYAIDAFFATCLGVGLIVMRILPHLKHEIFDGPNRRRENWNRISIIPWQISITASVLMLTSNAYPLVASWLPSTSLRPNVPWYVVPTTACSVLASGIIYYLGMKFIWSNGRDRVVVRHVIFTRDIDNNERPVQAVEAFDAFWEVPPPKNRSHRFSGHEVASI